MRPLIILIIIVTASACQSTKQATAETLATARSDSVTASSVDSASIGISAIRSDLDITLSGISISYCGEGDREEARPRAVQSPRSIHIAHASIKSSSRASSLKSTRSSATDSAAVRSVTHTGQRQQSTAEVNKHTASATALKFLLPAILILIAVFIIRKIRSPA